jgi:hypothetical protein
MIGEMAGLSSGLSESIARADMMVDYNLNSTSFSMDSQEGLAATIFNNVTGIAQDWHFPSGDQLAHAVDVALSTYDPKELGENLHIIQDSFSHFGFETNHVLATVMSKFGKGRDPDDPKSDINKAVDMAMLTLDILKAYRQRVLRKVIAAVTVALTCLRI